MTMGNPGVNGARDGQKTAGSLRVPDGATWFAVEKLVRVVEKESGKAVEKYKTQFVAHPSEPGVKVTQVPIPEGGLNDAQLRAEIANTWGFGFYRLRWSKGGRSTPFQIVDAEKTEAAGEAFGGKVPRFRTVGEDGQPASPLATMELMPPEVQKGFAMIAALKQLTAGDLALQQQQQQQHFQLMLEMVKESRQAAPAAGALDARDIKIAMYEAIAPLTEKINRLENDNARLRRQIDDEEPDDEDEIDWEKPLGEILGIEVKKAIVDLASDLTPEVIPLVKVAVPAFLQNLKGEIAKARLTAAAGTKANGVG